MFQNPVLLIKLGGEVEFETFNSEGEWAEIEAIEKQWS